MTAEIDAVIAAFYAAFDNRGGRVPVAEDLRGLFTEAATVTRAAGDEIDTWDPDGFVEPRIALLTGGTLVDFHEWETGSRTLVLDHIASRWSTYEKEGKLDGAEYRGGGHKLIQLHRVGGRWLISSLLWEDD